MLRSTGKVMRGLGSIRQDVNVSIEGGARIEIKGAQDLRMIPTLVENEAMRQMNLLVIKAEMKRVSIPGKIADVNSAFKESTSKIISKAEAVLAVRLPDFSGFVGRELVPGKRLGTEFSDYAKVAAGVGGIFHSDELPNYGITLQEKDKVREILDCRKDDAFVIVADTEDKSVKALDAVIMRAKMVFDGIPQEVRKANPDGTSSFMRPIPGEARMYPETDVMPAKAKHEDMELPELIDEKARRYSEAFKLGKDLAMAIARSGKGPMFELFVSEFQSLKPAFIAETIFSMPQNVKREYKIEQDITQDQLETLLTHINSGKLPKESLMQAMSDIVQARFDIANYQADTADLEKDIKEIIAKNKGATFAAIMGEVMKKYRGKADGKLISEILRKEI
jgi:glutamyl-tRNA(Gln) amidotransferase subunit E